MMLFLPPTDPPDNGKHDNDQSQDVLRVVFMVFIVLLFVSVGLLIYERLLIEAEISEFDLTGPVGKSTIGVDGNRPSFERYSNGSKNQLGVLLSDTNSQWLGLAHGLKSAGIPFRMTTRVKSALSHEVILVYPRVSGAQFDRTSLDLLKRHVEQGGTIVGFNVFVNSMNKMFGIRDTERVVGVNWLRFNNRFESTSDFTHASEKTVPIGDPEDNQFARGYGYDPGGGKVLAKYSDGTPAIIRRDHSSGGRAYALGLDIGMATLRAHNLRSGAPRYFADHFEPGYDQFYRLLETIYVRGESTPLTISPVPDGKSLATIFTHDLDWGPSFRHSVRYAKVQKELGIKGTFFVHTKYVADWSDTNFFRKSSLEPLRKLRDMGMEIGSHSVSHSRAFDQFEQGTGRERYPEYIPRTLKSAETVEGTIFGELRVSKFLLESLVTERNVDSFRAGYLRYPSRLPESLKSTGYKYNSTATANRALTHLPYKTQFRRSYGGDVSVFEFPVTFQDENPLPLYNRRQQALDLANQIADYRGLFVVLLHPASGNGELKFIRFLVNRLGDRDWHGTIRQYGTFWKARNQLRINFEEQGDDFLVEITAPRQIKGLTINPHRSVESVQAEDEKTNVILRDSLMVIDELKGTERFILQY
jgi:peptidoglycan/xylan/chitin deacetylase (PgdA/CDA1 family)